VPEQRRIGWHHPMISNFIAGQSKLVVVELFTGERVIGQLVGEVTGMLAEQLVETETRPALALAIDNTTR
jgi:hypothetical protein